jgi:hypothetical protein
MSAQPMSGQPLQPQAAPPPQMGVPTHMSQQRPAGTPTFSSGVGPQIAVIDAPAIKTGAPWWLVGVVGFVCLGLGFVVGFLAGGK